MTPVQAHKLNIGERNTCDAADLRVETIRQPERFGALREEWDSLLQTSASNCLFLTWEWLYTWWKHFAHSRQPHILAVRSPSELIALAPLVAPRISALQFLGTGNVGSDYLDFIFRTGEEERASRLLADELDRYKKSIFLTHLEESRYSATTTAAQLSARGWHTSSSPIGICPYLNLEGLSWEDFLATLGSSHRYNFRRRIRKLERNFDVQFDAARTEEQRREALRILIGLHNERWGPRGGSDALHRSALLSFHEEFSRLALRRGWLRLYVLRLDAKPVAAYYCFFYNGRFLYYQSGFDPALSKWSLGLVTLGFCIRRAIEEGAAEFDFLHGSEEYKFRWTQQVKSLVRLELYPPGAAGLLHRSGMRLYRASRKLGRRFLKKKCDGATGATKRAS